MSLWIKSRAQKSCVIGTFQGDDLMRDIRFCLILLLKNACSIVFFLGYLCHNRISISYIVYSIVYPHRALHVVDLHVSTCKRKEDKAVKSI